MNPVTKWHTQLHFVTWSKSTKLFPGLKVFTKGYDPLAFIIDLVWFYGTSTIVGYSMPNPFLYI